MHTVDLLEEAIALAEQTGFEIRREVLSQSGGGACRVGARWLLYIDQSLPAAEQLSQVVQALRRSAVVAPLPESSPHLRNLLAPGGITE